MRRRLLVLPMTLLLSLALAAPAQAATVTVNDKRGDAPAAHDITKVIYRNDPTVFVAHVRFRNLTKTKRDHTVGLVFAVPRSDVFIYLDATRLRQGGQRNHLILSAGQRETRISCPGMRVTWSDKNDLVSLIVPAECSEGLGHPGARVAWSSSYRGTVYGTRMDSSKMVRILYN